MNNQLFRCRTVSRFASITVLVILVTVILISYMGVPSKTYVARNEQQPGYVSAPRDVTIPVENGTHISAYNSFSLPSENIFYNRVPKCGSSAILQVFRVLEHINNVKTIHSNVYTQRALSIADQAEFARFFNNLTGPFIYDRHLYFIDFSRFGARWPTYINVIRDPLERKVSQFYFKTNGRVRDRKYRDSNTTFDEDFAAQNNQTILDSMVRFFCGHPVPDGCRRDMDTATLAKAKTNVQQHYAVVGLYEDLGSFFKVLEVVSPRVFSGAGSIYAQMNSTLYSWLATHDKIPPSKETAERWKKMAAVEYDFYYFIKKRFHEQMLTLGLL